MKKERYPYLSIFGIVTYVSELFYSYCAVDNIVKRAIERRYKRECWEIIDFFIVLFIGAELLLTGLNLSRHNGWVFWLFGYRIACIISGQWHFVFKSQYEHFEHPAGLRALELRKSGIVPRIKLFSRAGLIGLANYAELVFMFAYFHSLYSFDRTRAAPQSFIDFIYFSGVTITTLGYGDFYPHTGAGKFLSLLELFLGLVIILFYITTVLSNIKSPKYGN